MHIWLASSSHLSKATLHLLQKTSRSKADKDPTSGFFGFVLSSSLRPADDRVTPDKLTKFTPAVRQAFFSICPLQRHSPSDYCIQLRDLQLAVYVAETLRWGAASFVCRLLTKSRRSGAFRLGQAGPCCLLQWTVALVGNCENFLSQERREEKGRVDLRAQEKKVKAERKKRKKKKSKPHGG